MWQDRRVRQQKLLGRVTDDDKGIHREKQNQEGPKEEQSGEQGVRSKDRPLGPDSRENAGFPMTSVSPRGESYHLGRKSRCYAGACQQETHPSLGCQEDTRPPSPLCRRCPSGCLLDPESKTTPVILMRGFPMKGWTVTQMVRRGQQNGTLDLTEDHREAATARGRETKPRECENLEAGGGAPWS